MSVRIHARIGGKIVCGQANASSIDINTFRSHSDFRTIRCKRCINKIAKAMADMLTSPQRDPQNTDRRAR